MKTKAIRVTSFLFVFVMIATLFSGCNKNEPEYSEYSIIEEIPGATSGNNNSDTSSGTDSADNKVDASNTNSGTNSSASKNTDGAVNPADYKGTTVKYATWQYADGIDTDAAIERFRKKYGINVEIVTVPQETYIQEVTALINAGNAPDVVRDWDYWPSFLTIAQPLENAKIDLSDSIWDKDSLEYRKLNGKHYGLTSVGGLFKGSKNIVFYNKKLLNSHGIKTPEDYKNIGKWNFDAVHQIAKSAAAIGKGYYGIYAEGYGSTMACSYGTDLFKYSNGKFSIGTSDPNLISMWQTITEWNKEGLYTDLRSDFIDSKCGLAVATLYGLKKSGFWREMNSKDIGYIEMPEFNGQQPQPTVGTYFFGIGKGAKNPVAAGIFLRYYLDVNNYDINSEFISSDAANFAVKTSSSLSGNTFYSANNGVCVANGISIKKYYQTLFNTDPSQISQTLQSMSNELNSYAKNAQKMLDSYAN